MLVHVRSGLELLRLVFHWIAFVAICLMAIGLLGYAALCAFGLAPWLTFPLTFGELLLPEAGIYIQLLLTGLAAVLCFYLPTNARIMALETSHRSFHMGMRDVATAYSLAHRADREGVFQLKGEFDSIRERIAFLRDHPDLAEIEPSVLELASQMSHVSHELAEVYSDSAVARARDFLIARQQEIETFNERIESAKAIAVDIRQWVDRIDMEEAVATAQIARLREELAELLPELTHSRSQPPTEPDQAGTGRFDASALERAVANITKLEPRAAE